MYQSGYESSDLSDLEETCDDNTFDKTCREKEGPRLSKEEISLLNTYTYDKEPVKAWRQNSDYRVLRECNEYRWYEISKFLGKFSGFKCSSLLYQNPSRLCNLVFTLICTNKCYFLPEKCFLKHGCNFKELMKKTLHDAQTSEFKELFKEAKDGLKIEHDVIGRPNLWKLAEEIGFNTPLEYNEDGYLNVDYSVFEEKYWNEQRPAFVKAEKKVLDVIHGLLISSTKKQEEEETEAQKIYSLNLNGLNSPILKTMCYGPDVEFKTVDKNINCDISKDEKKVNFDMNVQHPVCSDLYDEKHWKYQHGEADISDCEKNQGLVLEGPACSTDSVVFYPCNLKHCWKCCECKFCRLAKIMICKDHKNHIGFNIKDCPIQENAQCQEHWVNHIENVNKDEEIEVQLNIFFHGNQLIKNGRNYKYKTLKYSGLKVYCKKCRRNTADHLSNHLTPHMQCKHCIYETKTMVDENFWGKVCNMCGKIFENKAARLLHAKRYNVSEQVCELCTIKCSSKFNLNRHMVEQHDAMQESNPLIEKEIQDNAYSCEECNLSFKYLRNLNMHHSTVHGQQETYKCLVCKKDIKTKFTLKRHLEEQHKVYDLENPIQSKESVEFVCDICEISFKRKEHLVSHMKTHKDTQNKYTCSDCGKQFTTKFSLNRHQMAHSKVREHYKCNTCQKTFSSKGNLARHIQGIHTNT